jgi:hypothetical protein
MKLTNARGSGEGVRTVHKIQLLYIRVTMDINDKNAKTISVKNSHINSHISPTKDIIGISLTKIFPFSSFFPIVTLIEYSYFVNHPHTAQHEKVFLINDSMRLYEGR